MTDIIIKNLEEEIETIEWELLDRYDYDYGGGEYPGMDYFDNLERRKENLMLELNKRKRKEFLKMCGLA